jgi:hypothetical protein
MSPLERAILRTLTWFDISSYPLTAFECWQYLYTESEKIDNYSISQVINTLEKLTKEGMIKNENGFWQLASSPSHFFNRQQQARWALPKRKRAQKGARLLSYLPFVRFVGLANTMAFDAPRQANSDIDFFIVLGSNRLFIGRLFVTLIVHLFGWRRYGERVHNRLCLSFYITENNLNLEQFSKKDDPYLRFWVASLVPLFDRGIYDRLIKANAWVTKDLPNWQKIYSSYINKNKKSLPSIIQRILELLFGGAWGNWCEKVFYKFQMKHILPYVADHLNNGTTDVVISEKVVKMHTNDRRVELAAAFRKRLLG